MSGPYSRPSASGDQGGSYNPYTYPGWGGQQQQQQEQQQQQQSYAQPSPYGVPAQPVDVYGNPLPERLPIDQYGNPVALDANGNPYGAVAGYVGAQVQPAFPDLRGPPQQQQPSSPYSRNLPPDPNIDLADRGNARRYRAQGSGHPRPGEGLIDVARRLQRENPGLEWDEATRMVGWTPGGLNDEEEEEEGPRSSRRSGGGRRRRGGGGGGGGGTNYGRR